MPIWIDTFTFYRTFHFVSKCTHLERNGDHLSLNQITAAMARLLPRNFAMCSLSLCFWRWIALVCWNWWCKCIQWEIYVYMALHLWYFMVMVLLLTVASLLLTFWLQKDPDWNRLWKNALNIFVMQYIPYLVLQ